MALKVWPLYVFVVFVMMGLQGSVQYVFIHAWWRIWQREHAFFDLLQYRRAMRIFSLIPVAPHFYCRPAAKDCYGQAKKPRNQSYLPRAVTSWSDMDGKQNFRVSRATFVSRVAAVSGIACSCQDTFFCGAESCSMPHKALL